MSAGPALAERLTVDPDYPALKHQVIDATGLHYYADKDDQLAAHLERRMTEIRVHSCREYRELLGDRGIGDTELDALAVELTNGETYYFRHRSQFEALAELAVPALLERNRPTRHLRIWCAGCSIGPEPYTLSILLKTRFARELEGWRVQIIATDINRRFLAVAETALYGPWALRSVPEEELRRCFVQQGDRWRLRDTYKDPVSFSYHNLARHPFPPPGHGLHAFDLVLCRNVLLYFSRERARQIVESFRASLDAGGWLVLGPSDLNADNLGDFARVTGADALIYRKREATQEAAPSPGSTGPGLAPPPAPYQACARRSPPRQCKTSPAPVRERAVAPDAKPNLEGVRYLADRGDHAAAQACCRAMLSRDPVNPEGHFLLALLLEQSGEEGPAEAAFKRAIFLDRSFVLAHYRLGLHLQRRNAPSAARYFRNALRLLGKSAGSCPIPHGDGLIADDLRKMAGAQLQLVSKR